MNNRLWGLLVLLSLVWGASFFFVQIALKELSPLQITFLRVALACCLLHLFLFIKGINPYKKNYPIMDYFIMGLLNNAIPFYLLIWSQTYITSGVAAILNATTPLFTVLAAHLLTTDEKITTSKLFGVAAGFLGVAAMIGAGAADFGEINTAAQVICLLAALSYALAGIFGRRFRSKKLSLAEVAAGQTGTASIVLFIPLMLTSSPFAFFMPSLTVTASILALASFSTALAYILYFKILAEAGATNLLLVTFLVPVSALLLGVGILGETLESRHLAGMVLIGIGLAAIDGRLWQLFLRHFKRAVRAR